MGRERATYLVFNALDRAPGNSIDGFHPCSPFPSQSFDRSISYLPLVEFRLRLIPRGSSLSVWRSGGMLQARVR